MHNKNSLRTRIILISLPLLCALIVLLFVRLAIHFPFEVEKYYSSGIYPGISSVVSMISGMVSFSIWDLFWISLILLVLSGLLLVIFRTIKLKWFLIRIIQLLLLFYSLFYILWGFNYFRPGIEARLGWEKARPDEPSFRAVMDTLITHTNKNYVNISASEYAEIEKSVDESYRKNSHLLGINFHEGSKTKTIFLSSYFAKAGISGYFGPFFNEVHVNFYQLPLDYPFILAHERAHQFGIANEAEASLIAFIVCTNSNDQRLKYSGYMYLLLYFLGDAHQMPDYHDYIQKIDSPVMKDIRFREKYYDKLRNQKLEKIQDRANDIYLKSNHIHKGIKNYNQVVGLMLTWYKNSGHTIT